MEKSKKEIFLDYIQSTFPVGAKRSSNQALSFAESAVLHLKGNKDPDASLRH